jgi:hypothetical protein
MVDGRFDGRWMMEDLEIKQIQTIQTISNHFK